MKDSLDLFFIAVGVIDVFGILVALILFFVKAPARIAREVKAVVEPLHQEQVQTNRTLKQIFTQNALILDRSDR